MEAQPAPTPSKSALMWQNPEYRQRSREWAKKRYAGDGAVRAAKVECNRKYRRSKSHDPEWKAAQAARMRAYRQRKAACDPQKTPYRQAAIDNIVKIVLEGGL